MGEEIDERAGGRLYGIAADLGGAPNAAQQILCQMFALKVLRVQLLVKTILSGETVNRHTENYCLAWMNSARRDLEALNVLTVPSSERSLFEVPISEMTDEQLDEALRLVGNPGQQPLIHQRDGGETVCDQEGAIVGLALG